MLPDDVALAVILVTWAGYITSHLSLYFSYKWGQMNIRLTFEHLRKSSGILIIVLVYVLLHGIVLSVMVVGIQYPELLVDIIGTSIFWAATTTLPLAVCSVPLIMVIKPNDI